MKDRVVRVVGLVADEEKCLVAGVDECNPKTLYLCVFPPEFAAPLQEALQAGQIYLSFEDVIEFRLQISDDHEKELGEN